MSCIVARWKPSRSKQSMAASRIWRRRARWCSAVTLGTSYLRPEARSIRAARLASSTKGSSIPRLARDHGVIARRDRGQGCPVELVATLVSSYGKIPLPVLAAADVLEQDEPTLREQGS